MIITIDGPAGTGKGTLAAALSEALGFHHLDTGLLYRAVAWTAQTQNVPLGDEEALTRLAEKLSAETLKNPELRLPEVTEQASIVAAVPGVRAALLAWQRGFAALPPGAVLDGRDTGTVICPHADVKFFMTAGPEVRARRRQQELTARGLPASYEAVLEGITERDRRDRERGIAPLPAERPEDAILLDTSEKSREEVFTEAMRYVRRKAASAGLPCGV